MDRDRRPDFQPVVKTLRQSFSGEHGVGRVFWELGLLEKVQSHRLTPERLKGACSLVGSYQRAEDYVLEASDLEDAWTRSLDVFTATNDLLAWASELNLIISRSAKPEGA